MGAWTITLCNLKSGFITTKRTNRRCASLFRPSMDGDAPTGFVPHARRFFVHPWTATHLRASCPTHVAFCPSLDGDAATGFVPHARRFLSIPGRRRTYRLRAPRIGHDVRKAVSCGRMSQYRNRHGGKEVNHFLLQQSKSDQ